MCHLSAYGNFTGNFVAALKRADMRHFFWHHEAATLHTTSTTILLQLLAELLFKQRLSAVPRTSLKLTFLWFNVLRYAANFSHACIYDVRVKYFPFI